MGRKTAVQVKPDKVLPPEPTEAVEELDEVSSEAEAIETGDVALTDNVGEQSVEINVEGLIEELEAESRNTSQPDIISARRKLEDYLERKRIARDLEDFEDFEVN